MSVMSKGNRLEGARVSYAGCLCKWGSQGGCGWGDEFEVKIYGSFRVRMVQF